MPDAAERFVERMGLHFETDGVPRIGGRLFGLLLLEDTPLSLDEIAERLTVSKTSVSTNARLLESTGLIERTSRPGDRRDYYIAAPDQTRTLAVRLERVKEMGRLLEQGIAAVPASRKRARARFKLMAAFNDEAVELLVDLLERWRKGNPSA